MHGMALGLHVARLFFPLFAKDRGTRVVSYFIAVSRYFSSLSMRTQGIFLFGAMYK